jgi:hypothetical protein
VRNPIWPLTGRSPNRTPRGIAQLPEQTLRNPDHASGDNSYKQRATSCGHACRWLFLAEPSSYKRRV